MSKQTLVLVPGLGCTKELWAPQIDALSDRATVVIGDHTKHDRIKDMAAHILDSVDGPFAYAGLSMGGYIAFEMMRQSPERITKLALLDTSARADTPQMGRYRQEMYEAVEQDTLDPLIEYLMPRFIFQDRLDDTQLTGTVERMINETGAEVFKNQLAAIVNREAPYDDAAQSVKCPAVIIVGRDDVLTPPHVAQEIADKIPGAALEVIADCGHLSTIERPDEVNEILIRWLDA